MYKIHQNLAVTLLAFICSVIVVLFSFFPRSPTTLMVVAQQPTGSIPTVTGTPEGPKIIVYADQDIIGVFAGPSAYIYPQVGILLAGEEAPALGYSLDGDWIQIVYVGTPGGKGWIYAPFVGILRASELKVIPNPPTATPFTTPTIDPTQAAQFGFQILPVHLATFTEPPPIEIPIFSMDDALPSGFPTGLIIIGLLLVGVLGAVISFLRGR